MHYQEITKLFGKPLSEVVKPQTVNQLKLEYFLAGFGIAILAGALWYSLNELKEENPNNKQSLALDINS